MLATGLHTMTRTAEQDIVLGTAERCLLEPYELQAGKLARVLGALGARRIDYADLYFQYSRSESWSLEEGIVKSGSFNIDQGVGVRAISGDKTAFAYSDEISFDALQDAARATRVIAAAGQNRRVPARRRRGGTPAVRRYVPLDPIATLPSEAKVALLEKLERMCRALDPRVVQVMAHLGGEYEVVLIARSDGVLAAAAGIGTFLLLALLSPPQWTAKWIAAQPDGAAPGLAMPIFRYDFRLERRISRAIAYISGLGQYELSVNGRRIGDAVLAPGWTNYRKTVFYNACDVTRDLRPGANAVGVMLGNGMYNVPMVPGRYTKFVGSFGPPKLIAQIRVTFADDYVMRALRAMPAQFCFRFVVLLAGLVGPKFGVGYWIVVIIGNIFIVGFEGLIVGIQAYFLPGLLAIFIALFFGTILGVLAGYRGGRWDTGITYFTNLVDSFPRLVLMLLVIAAFKPDIWYIMLVLGVTNIPVTASLVKGKILFLKQKNFIEADIALGLVHVHLALFQVALAQPVSRDQLQGVGLGIDQADGGAFQVHGLGDLPHNGFQDIVHPQVGTQGLRNLLETMQIQSFFR